MHTVAYGVPSCVRGNTATLINPYPLLPFLFFKGRSIVHISSQRRNPWTSASVVMATACCHCCCCLTTGEKRKKRVFLLLQVHFNAFWHKLKSSDACFFSGALQVSARFVPNPLTHPNYYKCFSNTLEHILFTCSWGREVSRGSLCDSKNHSSIDKQIQSSHTCQS